MFWSWCIHSRRQWERGIFCSFFRRSLHKLPRLNLDRNTFIRNFPGCPDGNKRFIRVHFVPDLLNRRWREISFEWNPLWIALRLSCKIRIFVRGAWIEFELQIKKAFWKKKIIFPLVSKYRLVSLSKYVIITVNKLICTIASENNSRGKHENNIQKYW